MEPNNTGLRWLALGIFAGLFCLAIGISTGLRYGATRYACITEHIGSAVCAAWSKSFVDNL